MEHIIWKITNIYIYIYIYGGCNPACITSRIPLTAAAGHSAKKQPDATPLNLQVCSIGGLIALGV
jgi:hypothetical protein